MKLKPSRCKSQRVLATALGLLACGVATSSLADYGSTVLSKAPVGYWRFNETNQVPTPAVATNYGSAGSPGNGFYINGIKELVPDAMPATTATAPAFNGFSQKIEVPYNAALNPANGLTVEAWVKPMSIDGYDNKWFRAVVRTGSARSGGGYQIQFDAGSTTTPGFFKFTLWNGTGSLEIFNTNTFTSGGWTILATNGAWAHLVGTWSSADGIGRIYVNGQELTNRAFAYAPNTNGLLRVGAGEIDPPEPWGQSFDPGPVSQVAVYDYQLTSEQILAHYQNGTSASPSQTYEALVLGQNPVGYWPLKETSIPAQPVLTNLGSLGTALNGAYGYRSTPGTAGPQGPNYGGFETNNLSGAISAEGGSAWVPPVNSGGNILSIVAWIKRNGSQMAYATILGRRVPGGEKSAFCFLTGNELAYNWDDNASQYNFNSKLVVPDNVWTMAGLVITPTNAVIYMDYGAGLQAATNVFANTTTSGFTHEALIGPSGPYAGRRFNGSIDELAVFNKALTYSDMMDLRTAALANGFFVASQPPASRPVMLGGSATFPVIAGAGTSYMPLTYQLLKNGAPVGSPTSNPDVLYTGIGSADLGSSFQVVVKGTGGSITSSVATLSRWTVPGTYSMLVESLRPDAYYRFGESSTASIFDIGVGGPNDGSALGPVAAAAGPAPTDQVGFESSNQGIEIGTTTSGVRLNGTPINTNTVTIAMWLYPNGAQNAFTGLYYTRGMGTSTNNYVGLQVDRTPGSPGTQLSLAWSAAPNPYDWHTGVYIAPNLWNFVAVTITNDSATMYSYTAEYGWQSATINQNFPLPTGLVAGNVTAIGIDPNTALSNRYFKGKIDEVVVWNRTLSQSEVEKLALAAYTVYLGISPAGAGTYQVGWSYGTLQWADSPSGTWSNVPGATAPAYTFTPSGTSQKYFRALVQ